MFDDETKVNSSVVALGRAISELWSLLTTHGGMYYRNATTGMCNSGQYSVQY